MHEPDGLSDDVSDHLTVDRTVELEVDRDRLWALIATPEGWRDWLVDEAQLVDGAGIVVDRGVTRPVRVDEVVDGESVRFTWWDDETRRPSPTSEAPDHRRGPAAHRRDPAGAGAPQTAEARLAWEVRVCSLWACTVAAALSTV